MMNMMMQDENHTVTAANWSKEENKRFEKALAKYDDTVPDRWQRIAHAIPGKTVSDVQRQYLELEADLSQIEAGLVPIPRYYGIVNRPPPPFQPRSSLTDHDRTKKEKKKGVPWTEEEHRRFLMGLEKYGKGEWRNISRNFVISKTPTQVASHAQKYFIRLNSGDSSGGGKDNKRRPSIHDITTIHLTDSTPIISDNNKNIGLSTTTPVQWPHSNHINEMDNLFNYSNWDNPFEMAFLSY